MSFAFLFGAVLGSGAAILYGREPAERLLAHVKSSYRPKL